MARDTANRLREAALALFSERWYEVVSVAEICRTAGVSNGVFYRYFSTKEELFFSLLESFLEKFARDLDEIDGPTLEERVRRFVSVVAGAARRYAGEVAVFREGQYRFPRFEQRLRNLYVRTVERVYRRRISEVEYLYLLSGLRFIATRSLMHDLAIDYDLLVRLIMTGVFDATGERVELVTAEDPGEPTQDSARERFFHAAVDLIARHGFFAVQVVDIARAAGYSVGSFYKTFRSKESFFADLVHEIGHLTRHHLSAQLDPASSRWRQEVKGMWNFLHYFGKRPTYYEIVREAEFVVPESVRAYYDAFEHGYAARLTGFPPGQRSLVANFLMGLSHYLGIETLLQGSVADTREAVLELGRLLTTGIPT